jgi:hypothetical protein
VDALVWKRIGELFAAARELDAEQRLKFLVNECGEDLDLFQKVQALLTADTNSGVPDSASTISSLPVPELIAGRFRIRDSSKLLRSIAY